MADGKKVLELLTPSKREPNPELVECLKELLAQAEAGEIRGIAAAFDMGSGKPAQLFAAEGDASKGALILGVTLLRRKIEDLCMGEMENR